MPINEKTLNNILIATVILLIIILLFNVFIPAESFHPDGSVPDGLPSQAVVDEFNTDYRGDSEFFANNGGINSAEKGSNSDYANSYNEYFSGDGQINSMEKGSNSDYSNSYSESFSGDGQINSMEKGANSDYSNSYAENYCNSCETGLNAVRNANKGSSRISFASGNAANEDENRKKGKNGSGQTIPQLSFSDSSAFIGKYGRSPTHILPLIGSTPGDVYRAQIPISTEAPPAYRIVLQYCVDNLQTPVVGLFFTAMDQINSQFPNRIRFELQPFDKTYVTNYIKGHYNSGTGFVNYSYHAFPRILKIRANGDVLCYNSVPEIGAIQDWILDEEMLAVPQNNV